MKDFWKSWKFLVAVFAVLAAIVGLIMYFTLPSFKDVLLNIAIGIGGIAIGWIIGYNMK